MAEVKRDYSKMMNMFQSTAPETQTTTSGEHIDREKGYVDLSISMLEHFPEHPFELYTGERFEDLKESINNLDSDLKIIVILYYYEDMSIKDISESLNIPQGTIKSRLSRARKRLKEILSINEEVL